MRPGRFVRTFECFLIGATLVGSSPSRAQAQDGSTAHHPAMRDTRQRGDFIKIVRDATDRFRDVSVAIAEGYVLQYGCVSGSDEGAMGVHFVNFPLVGDPALDVTRPELLVYEPMPDGRMQLVAADYLVLAGTWHESNASPPELLGQLFHLFESPNRFGLPDFYTLHVWAWKSNPHGAFVNWHPNVSCDAYSGTNP